MSLNDKNFVWQCRQILAKNSFKVYFSIITVFVIWIITVFSVYLLSFGSGNILSVVLLFFAGWFCSVIVAFSLIYGYDVLLLKIVRNEQAVLGHLFEGFKNLKKMVKPGLFFGALFFALAMAGSLILVTVKGELAFDPGTMTVSAYLILTVFFVVCFWYLFFPFVLHEKSDLPLRVLLAESRKLFNGNRIAFLKNFILFAWKSLCLFLFSYFFVMFWNGKDSAFFSAMMSFISFIGTISAYVTVVKFFLLGAVFYHRLTAAPADDVSQTDAADSGLLIESDEPERERGNPEIQS